MDPITALTGGLSLLKAGQTLTAGRIQAREAEIGAKAEEVAAIQREADRKSRLAAAMASQIAGAGARGIAAFEGSPLAVLEEDIRREELATERDIFQTRMATITQRARGKIAKGQARTQSLLGLGQAAMDIAPTFKVSDE